MKSRNQIINEARRQREEITQYFNDVSHWNNTRGKTEGIIDPDPDGSMHRLGEALDKMLAAENASKPNRQDSAYEQKDQHMNKKNQRLSGLQRICKLYGRMKCGDTMMVWDYANDVAVPESEMPLHSARWLVSEQAKRSEGLD